MADNRHGIKEAMRFVGRARFVLAGVCAFAAALAVVSPARAENPPAEVTEVDIAPSNTQAGGHPDIRVRFRWKVNGFNCGGRCLTTRQVASHMPTGVIGNPHVAPKCTLTEFNQGGCPSDSQLGYTSASFFEVIPVYNMETRPDQAGMMAFSVPFLNAPVFLELSGRTDSDYGLDTLGSPIPQVGLDIDEIDLHLWGVPADPIHNGFRFFSPLIGGACGGGEAGCIAEGATGAEPTVPQAPFLQNSVVCGAPLTVRVGVEWYEGTVKTAEAPWPERTGCQQLSFNPSQTVKPTTTSADTASGIDTDLKVPQTQSATTPTPSQIKVNRVTLPEGFSINAGAADGKVACADSETSVGTLFTAHCPEFSKVGTTEIDVAALPGPIFGAVYIGEPKPGERYRLVLTADGFATHVKLLATVELDRRTGRVTTTFPQPQAPIQRVNLHFFGSERGLLATPERCGIYEVENEFAPWDNQLTTRHATSFITIDSGPGGTPCPGGSRPFDPTLDAGADNTTAGAFAPFILTFDRQDGEQNLAGLTITTPPGFAASFKGIPYCPEAAIALLSNAAYSGAAEQASSACPPASQIGTAVTGAGVGSHPVYVSGKVFLAGPYKGAPLSLVAVVSAISGPYDLGNVAVRAAINVDPRTAQATTIADPLPQILEGVPLRARSVLIRLDRPGFTLNPTNCEPFQTHATIYGDEGGSSTRNPHFQVANCSQLNFAPKLGLRLRGNTRRRGHPALRAVVRRVPGEANLRRTVVAMPRTLLLDNAHIGTVCTRVQFADAACPAGSVYGHATLETPLLEEPLKGNVFLRSSSGRLPDLVVALRGQFDIDLSGQIDTTKAGALRTTFNGVPDAPFEKFVLDLRGGRKGLLVNSSSLCKRKPKAMVTLAGQNGMRESRRTTLRMGCRKAAKRRGRRLRYRKRAVR